MLKTVFAIQLKKQARRRTRNGGTRSSFPSLFESRMMSAASAAEDLFPWPIVLFFEKKSLTWFGEKLWRQACQMKHRETFSFFFLCARVRRTIVEAPSEVATHMKDVVDTTQIYTLFESLNVRAASVTHCVRQQCDTFAPGTTGNSPRTKFCPQRHA